MADAEFSPESVVGAMSKDGSEIADREVNHADLFHTWLSAVGLDPTDEFDIAGRTVPLADPTGNAIEELLA